MRQKYVKTCKIYIKFMHYIKSYPHFVEKSVDNLWITRLVIIKNLTINNIIYEKI